MWDKHPYIYIYIYIEETIIFIKTHKHESNI